MDAVFEIGAYGMIIFAGTMLGLGLAALVVWLVSLAVCAPGERAARRRERRELDLDQRRRYWEGRPRPSA